MAKMKYETYTKKMVRGAVYFDKVARYKYNLAENEEVLVVEKPNCIEIRKKEN